MSPLDRYFDYAATTPIDPRVREVMLPFLADDFGNANSIHRLGQHARAAVESAREKIAALIGAEDPSEIIFTSGATESNNWVLRSFSNGYVSPFEHSSVREPAHRFGYRELTNVDYALEVPDKVDLASVMLVNNETGAILDPSRFRRAAAFLHSDITQAVGKIPVDVQQLEVDAASFSAHKIYGPKGVGALYLKGGSLLEPFMIGGEQENGLRGGTLNVPGIVGFGKAAELLLDEMERDVQLVCESRRIAIEELSNLEGVQFNEAESASPFILSASFGGLQGETIVVEADTLGFAISSGAACSSRSTEPSHVLVALGLVDYWLMGTVRISFGRFVSADSTFELTKALKEAVGTIRRLSM